MKLSDIYNWGNKYKGRYSIEIEMEARVDCTDFFMPTADGSLGERGVEFISKRPASKEVLLKEVDNLLSQEGLRGYKPSPRTSTHIHCNVQDWTEEELFTVLTVYYLVEGLLTNYTGRSRKGNLFCLSLFEAEGGANGLRLLKARNSGCLMRDFEVLKYSALNTASIVRLGTIEFRQMRGISKAQELSPWLDIIDNIVRQKDLYTSPLEVWEDFQIDRVSFARRVFGETWKFVDKGNIWEILDLNYSLVYDFVSPDDYEDNEQRDKTPYYFMDEVELDTAG